MVKLMNKYSSNYILSSQLRHIRSIVNNRDNFFHKEWVKRGLSVHKLWLEKPADYVKYILSDVNKERLSLETYCIVLKKGKRSWKPDNLELKRRDQTDPEDKLFLNKYSKRSQYVL